jgi:hypothetical protein
MSLFRRLLGLKAAPCRHEPATGWCGSAPYGVLDYVGTDGMLTVHMAVQVRCRHCGETMEVARFHTSEAVLNVMDAERKARRRSLSEPPTPPTR